MRAAAPVIKSKQGDNPMTPPETAHPRPIPGVASAGRIALIYAFISASWIFGSDLLLQAVFSDATLDRVTQLQTIKGLFFVFSTAALIYFLIRDALLRIQKSQRALEASEDRFKRMVEWSPVGICIHVEGRFRYVNRAMMDVLGATEPEQLLGRPVLDFVHPDYHAIIKQRLKGIREHASIAPLLEGRGRRLDGAYVWVEVTGIPLEFEGEPGVQSMIRDIHARKQAEADLRQLNETLERRVAERTAELQEANEDLRTFSYTLSHDLRAPLRSIGRFGEEIVQGVSEADNRSLAQENARRIVAATARLDRLILDLYEYNQLARTEARSRRISLILIVNEIVGQIKREPEFANVEFNIREPMPWVLAHRPTLAMVLHNLLSNAVKFVTPPTQPVVTISATVVKEQARLTVEDNGKGIEQTRAQSLFALLDQPADDVESSGEGIGLAIVRRGVERMGGCVGVESTPGVGSRFWIELPLDPQSP